MMQHMKRPREGKRHFKKKDYAKKRPKLRQRFVYTAPQCGINRPAVYVALHLLVSFVHPTRSIMLCILWFMNYLGFLYVAEVLFC